MEQYNHAELVHRAVVPGASSGVYYIPVSNLSPDMTFNDLRFLARQAASVEKCFIYPNTCEGWVRVRSHAHFLKAYNYLNGLEYRGSTLSASNKNENSPIDIWELKKSPHSIDFSCSTVPSAGPTLQYLTGDRSFTSAASYGGGYYLPGNGGASSSVYGAYYVHDQNTAAPGYDSGYSSGASSSGYQYQFGNGASTGGHVLHSSNAIATVATLSSPSYEGDGQTAWYSPTNNPSYGHQGSSNCPGEPQETVKVIVKNLSRHASHRELESYLLKAVGGKHKLHEAIRFPRLAGAGSGRQHAFLLFKSHSDALAALDKLDKTKLLGLPIEARFATETVVPPESLPRMQSAEEAATTAAITSDAGAGDSARNHSFAISSATPAFGSKQDVYQHQPKCHNLVVDGSSAYGRTKRAEAASEKSSEHKDKK